MKAGERRRPNHTGDSGQAAAPSVGVSKGKEMVLEISEQKMALKCTIQALLFIISQSLFSIYLMDIKCDSFITVLFHFSIPVIGAMAAIVLQNKGASIKAWVTLYAFAAVINVVLWELIPPIPMSE
jgi:hypothetical protein